jgi:helicase
MNTLHLNKPQFEIYESCVLDSGFNCILQMQTGSGKTWLAEQAINKTLQQGLRAIYLSPLKALADELTVRWQERFLDFQVGIFTGDYGLNGKNYPIPFRDARLLVMTPERLDACTRSWRGHWTWIPEVDLLVVDEFHLLADLRRGARLEGALSRFRQLNPFARVLGLSATLGNRMELAEWAAAVEYYSPWRPVPLEWRTARFRRASEKPELLLKEVKRNIESHGKSLVFLQSRRRAERISSYLTENGIRSHHHHAGLNFQQRGEIEHRFRTDQIDVLVATSTLEMGLNLPVRQVVIYDLQEFDGYEYRPLPTYKVWQRAGRAGRPGLDESGEVLILAPIWDRTVEQYEKGNFEPIRSAFRSERAVSEQVIAEVSSGHSVTSSQIVSTFSRSLAAHQGILPDVKTIVKQMIDSGMLAVHTDDTSSKNKFSIKATRIGRIAARHFLHPETVLLFQRNLQIEELSLFDLMLICGSSTDCEPVLPCDFEELEELSSRVRRERSFFLQSSKTVETLGVDGKRLLSSLKMALVASEWCSSGDAEKTAVKFNCYAFEVVRLRDSLVRLLSAMYSMIKKPLGDLDIVEDLDSNSASERVRILLNMVSGGLDEYAATMTLIRGIGPRLAKRLHDLGISDLLELSKTDVSRLPRILGISKDRLLRWVHEADAISRTFSVSEIANHSPTVQIAERRREFVLDPYRLRRAVELTVSSSSPNQFIVSGGTEPHIVRIAGGEIICDCLDSRRRSSNSHCKHLLALRIHMKDPLLENEVRKLKENSSDDPFDVFDLWYKRGSPQYRDYRK